MTTREYDPPVDPVEDGECLHCHGSLLVEDDQDVPGIGLTAVAWPCDRCEDGVAPVDARGRCACDDCLHLPYDDRLLTEAALAEHEATQTPEENPR